MRAVDHLVLPVPDLAGSSRRLESEGFVVTPQADHPFGTSNRLLVLENGYLELVSVTRAELVPPTGFAADVREFLHRGSGVSHLVLSSSDTATDHAVLSRAQLAVGSIFDFSRPAPLPDGSSMHASFSLVFTTGSERIGCFVCQQLTPEAVWHPSALAHPNGASRLESISLPGSPPAAVDVLGTVEGLTFGADEAEIRTDGRHRPVRIGNATVAANA